MQKILSKRGLFYCQYLVGIGHLIRSLHLCRCLIKDFQIDFLQGGQGVNLSLSSSAFHLIQLPAIEGPLLFPENKTTLERRFQERQAIIKHLNTPYDFLITELFPFSKWEFKEEVFSLIKQVKTINPHCLIFCSLRDSFIQNTAEREKKILEILNRDYAAVFVHSDPRVFQLQESFSLQQKITPNIIYTGFIANPEARLAQRREKRIVTSLGEGAFGQNVMEAVLKIAPDFPDYQFAFIMGPKSPPSLAPTLKKIAKEIHASNIKIESFIDNFPDYLNASALSISLGGYTIMDAVYTKTPALVIPTKFLDQYIRSLKFHAFGFIHVLTDQQLDPASLKTAIQNALKMPIPSFDIDMQGAQTTSREIQRIIANKT